VSFAVFAPGGQSGNFWIYSPVLFYVLLSVDVPASDGRTLISPQLLCVIYLLSYDRATYKYWGGDVIQIQLLVLQVPLSWLNINYTAEMWVEDSAVIFIIGCF
jgi:hypothetical protein